MGEKKEYFKTKIEVLILSEYRLSGNESLADLHELTMGEGGDCSAKVEFDHSEAISSKEAAKLLQEQGSDPAFFQLDHNGNDLGED